jgi:hypothetical protein
MIGVARRTSFALTLLVFSFTPRAGAVPVEYIIDSSPGMSGLGVTGNLAGSTIVQRSGTVGFIPLSGTLEADRTGNTITFTGGQATAANQSGNYPPGVEGDPFSTAKANFAFFTAAVDAAVRELALHPVSLNPTTIGAQGKLPTDSFEIAIDGGGVDYLRNDFQGGRADITTLNPNQFRSNLSNLQPTVTQTGNTEYVVLPFKFSVFFSVFTTNDSELTFTGEIDASREIVPEPAGLVLVPLLVTGLGRRRRR